MTDPEHPLLVRTWSGTFNHSHSVAVDTTRALLFCNGTRNNAQQGTGMGILSLADPENPVELAMWPGGFISGEDDRYVHDCVAVGNRVYASSVYSGHVRILDLTNPAAPFEMTSWTYPGGFTHNSWPDVTGRYLYVTDEVNGEPLKIFDIANLYAPVLVNAITSNPLAIVHNAHVNGNDLVLANYTEGVRMLDLSDPVHPAEFAWADSWGGKSGSYFGIWGVCPFFPSGTVIGSDMQTGLYVYRPVRSYGIARVEVVEAGTNAPLAGAIVRLATQGDSLMAPSDGVVQFAPSPGAHTIEARKFGWVAANAAVSIATGSRDTIRLELARRPTATVAGTVSSSAGGAPLEDAEIAYAGTPVGAHTDGAGAFSIADVPVDVYRASVRRPGFVSASYDRAVVVSSTAGENIVLAPAAFHDALESEGGWTVGAPGDAAWLGIWTRVAPIGSGGTAVIAGVAFGSARGGAAGRAAAESDGRGRAEIEHDGAEIYPKPVSPYSDRTPGAGTMCFVTGQGTNPGDVWENSVYGGKTTLTSPSWNLSAVSDPVIAYWRWFFSDGDANDWMAVLVSRDGGASWTPVDTVRGGRNQWEEASFRVRDRVTPSSQVRLRFVAADLGVGTLVEAAIDDVAIYEAGTAPVAVTPALPSRLAFLPPSPNPSSGTLRLELDLPAAGPLVVEVIDLAGRRVSTLHRGTAAAGRVRVAWDGRDGALRRVRSGLYYVRARANGATAVTRIVRAS